MLRKVLYRTLVSVLVLGLVNVTTPLGLAAVVGNNPYVKAAVPARKAVVRPQESRWLTRAEMKKLQGRQAQNPYTAGSGKWGVQLNGVDQLTGNYTLNATDLSFDPSFGIPVNVSRTYSANNQDEGPLGFGWTLSVDIRSTAGGVFISSGAPSFSVPVSFQERPAAQTNDPNAPMGVQPVAAVIATNAVGAQETIQKDVDGVLTTPPWDNNTICSTYEYVPFNGGIWQVLYTTTTTTPDGAVYSYSTHGAYSSAGGMQAWPVQSGGQSQPSNILKADKVTDRQGNVSQYTYGIGGLTFQKYNGQTTEDGLTQISMPDGRYINFTWGNGSTGPVNRIVSATDGTRTVVYAYSPFGELAQETDPSGLYPAGSGTPIVRRTQYQYAESAPLLSSLDTSSASHLLTGITDSRGMTTAIEYCVGQVNIPPYNVPMQAVVAYHVLDPIGIDHYLLVTTDGVPSDCPDICDTSIYSAGMQDRQGGAVIRGTTMVNSINTQNAYFQVRLLDDLSSMGGGPEPPDGPNAWQKTYDAYTQDLVEETHFTRACINNDLSQARQMTLYDTPLWITDQVNTYNFQGNPLTQTVSEYGGPSNGLNGPPLQRTTTTNYAYWDSTRFYQQKAVVDNAGRISYTDYYQSGCPAGSLGKKEYVYNSAFTNFSNSSGNGWQTNIAPSNPATYAGMFQYDGCGRTTNVSKLHNITGTTYSYVQTSMSYYSNSAPDYGEAYQVTEDAGGATPRTTINNNFTPWGKACDVTDAAGNRFVTTYQYTGDVQSIENTTTGATLVSYTYGTDTTPQGQPLPNFGVPIQILDGLTGVAQSITYQETAGTNGFGQVCLVTQSGGANPSYTVAYLYTPWGDRAQAEYETADGNAFWLYGNYISVGSFDQKTRVFQTLNHGDGSGNPTAEEMHYAYDTAGRVRQAAFAQTPQTGTGAPKSAPFYTASYPAASRAISFYDYDGGGRLIDLQQGWQNWAGGAYGATQCVLRNTSSYGNSELPLKTESDMWGPASGSPTTWAQTSSETYSYDSQRDYLTGANYNNGQLTPIWAYDAAGNRTDSTVDDLNRTMVNGLTNCDVLGNRLSLGSSTTYAWDCLSRMTSYTSSGTTTNYEYRADGMRTHKASPLGFTEYYHDGQMPIKDVALSGGTYTGTRYGIGVRGIDYMEAGTSSAPSRPTAYPNVGFPLYDGHGNMIAMLARSGSGYSLGNQRNYDPWGSVRGGVTTGPPSQRYCASLGHQQDDESGLIYMRARYYEPGSGRFISEDPAANGGNWFVYASNRPSDMGDANGKNAAILFAAWELTKGLLNIAGKQAWGDKNATPADVFKVTFKTVYGIQEGYISAWCLQMAKSIFTECSEAYAAAMTSGNGLAADGVLDAGAYSLLILFFIDAVDVGSGDSLADAVSNSLFGPQQPGNS